jgi:alkylation response protein AidB-like acyl-CoA dehydrogenase
MDFSLGEVETAASELARKIFRERVTPASLREVEREKDRFDRALWKELATADLLGTSLPESAGGSGHGFLATCALLVEVGAAVAPVPLWPTLVLGTLPIVRFGTDEQRRSLLDGVATGETILTAALAETGPDDLTQTHVRARSVGGGWELHGLKVAVPAAHLAKRVLVTARTENDQVGVFVIDPRATGVRLEEQVATSGEPWSRITLTGARVAPGDVLGEVGHGEEIRAWLVARATVGLCAMQLGVAERALRMTAEYATTRQQFERPIATFQAVAQRAADAYIDVEAIRVSLWQAAWRLANDLPAGNAVAIAKYWACEGGHRVTYAAQHLHGGMGFDLEYPLHRYYTWAKQIELTLGSASAQIAQLGASLARATEAAPVATAGPTSQASQTRGG